MTEFERRDVVKLLTAVMITGALAKPDKSKADGGGLDLSVLLIVLTILIVVAILALPTVAFSANMKTAKAVKDGSGNMPTPKQRLRNG
ncbi:hypothetical protein RXV86_07235 [Alisedimentitalea sp. MJ-SS2]|uniref:hypothetical protein n=1 Tax=Aliisedimentitalea sp. MJ-SS2 TaxID=3049795 RepID=UPI0029097E82|nr:hypothetical protein [Alisedimentitalea sp. MJ-SS2]MDU8927172.1 hypothetical protein [Alisedimentitalea sp. MJ-SS2]